MTEVDHAGYLCNSLSGHPITESAIQGSVYLRARNFSRANGLIMEADMLGTSFAVFSPCRLYRYLLGRIFDERPIVNFTMLNPSVATADVNDNTVSRCMDYAAQWQAGGLIVSNLYALRSTKPSALYTSDDPVGPLNDEAIDLAAALALFTVCAWGNHGIHANRGATVTRRLRAAGRDLRALSVNCTGEPIHPLYQKKSAEPLRFEGHP